MKNSSVTKPQPLQIDVNNIAVVENPSTYTGFLAVAMANIERGFTVHPLKKSDKTPFLKDWPRKASADPQVIEGWATSFPGANVGVCADERFCILESDNEEEFRQLIRLSTGNELPITYTVQARPSRPHWYFKQSLASRAVANLDIPGIFEFKQHARYVVAAGSIHPKTGQPYEVISDYPIPEMPDWLVTALQSLRGDARFRVNARTEKPAGGRKLGENEGRHPLLVSLAGQLWDGNKSEEQLLAELEGENQKYCDPPYGEGHLRSIVEWVVARAPNNAGPRVTVGPSVDPDEIAGPSSETPEVGSKYPVDVWKGTLFEQYLDACTRQHHYVPHSAILESLKTMTGAILGEQVRLKHDQDAEPRFFTVIIGEPGAGRGTAIKWAEKVFDNGHRSLLWRRYKETEERQETDAAGKPKGKPKRIEVPYLPWKNIGAWMGGGASAEILCNVGNFQPRMLMVMEELSTLVQKMSAPNSGESFADFLLSGFDRSKGIQTTLSLGRTQVPDTLHLSLLGSTQSDRWDECFHGHVGWDKRTFPTVEHGQAGGKENRG